MGPLGAEATTDCGLTPPPSWQRHDAVVMICGGVGVTAILSILRAMAAQRAAAASEDGGATADVLLPRKVYCLWAARRMEEFLILDRSLLLATT